MIDANRLPGPADLPMPTDVPPADGLRWIAAVPRPPDQAPPADLPEWPIGEGWADRPILAHLADLAARQPDALAASGLAGVVAADGLSDLLDGAVPVLEADLARQAADAPAPVLAEDQPLILLYHPVNLWAARAPLAYVARLDGQSPVAGAVPAAGRERPNARP